MCQEINMKYFYCFIIWCSTYAKPPISHLVQQNTAPLLREKESWASLCSGWAPFRMTTYSICYRRMLSGSYMLLKDSHPIENIREVCWNTTQYNLALLFPFKDTWYWLNTYKIILKSNVSIRTWHLGSAWHRCFWNFKLFIFPYM